MNRSSSSVLPLLVALCAAACGGSSATTVTAPSGLARCGVTLAGTTDVPAAGGTGTVTVSAARECSWTAAVEAPWLSIRSGASGQGQGTVEFGASANPDPVTRRGAIVLNDQRLEVAQAAGECAITLVESGASFPPAGGSGRVDVRASSALCTWTAEPDADWIVLRADRNGRGTASMPFEVMATAGAPRRGGIRVAGNLFQVTQSECSYAIEPATHTAGASGGSGTVAIATAAGCSWTAASAVPWLTLSPQAGEGPGAVTFTVAPTTGSGRTGSATIAGQAFSVVQSPGCSYAVEPVSHSVGAAGGTISVAVSAGAGCAWTAGSGLPWVTVTAGASGSGNGSVTFAVAAATAPREGSVSVAGQPVAIAQSGPAAPAPPPAPTPPAPPACSYTIAPPSVSIAAAGGASKAAVTTTAACAWTAESHAPWIQISSGASRTGSGDVTFNVAASAGPARSGTMTIAGRTLTVNQGSGCSFALSSTSQSIPAGGGSGTVDVKTAAGCSWTASSNASWLSITPPAGRTGPGSLAFTAAAETTGAARTGTLTIAGQAFTVSQGAACSFAISPAQGTVPAAGGTLPVTVTAAAGCAWTTASSVPWLTLRSTGPESGNGVVEVTAAANTGPARQGSVTIAGRTFSVTQDAVACTFAISPEQGTVAAAGGTLPVNVTAAAGCAWTTASTVPWLTLRSLGPETGNGIVEVTAAANTGPARQGSVTIAGRTFSVTQDAVACTFAISPEQGTVAAAGGTLPVDVTAGAGCAWTTASAVPWLTLRSLGPETGNGAVEVTAAANTGAARQGAVTIAGRTFTVSQDAAPCTFTLDPAAVDVNARQRERTIRVTAGPSCAWTASTATPWIRIDAGASGTGDGAVQITIAENTTGAPREGVVVVAGQNVPVTQRATADGDSGDDDD